MATLLLEESQFVCRLGERHKLCTEPRKGRMMTDPRHDFGARMEREAEAYLTSSPAPRRVIKRRFRSRTGEIDLILEEQLAPLEIELVFVEVKARNCAGQGYSPLDSVGNRKRGRIIRTAEVFLARYRGRATSVRFDVMAWDGQWHHHRGAWNP